MLFVAREEEYSTGSFFFHFISRFSALLKVEKTFDFPLRLRIDSAGMNCFNNTVYLNYILEM